MSLSLLLTGCFTALRRAHGYHPENVAPEEPIAAAAPAAPEELERERDLAEAWERERDCTAATRSKKRQKEELQQLMQLRQSAEDTWRDMARDRPQSQPRFEPHKPGGGTELQPADLRMDIGLGRGR